VKKLEAIIRPAKLDEIKEALTRIGVHGMTITDVKGFGRTGGATDPNQAVSYIIDFVPKIKIEIVIRDELVDKAIEAITTIGRTGRIGDGKVFVYPVSEAIRIRTGERGDDAV
jgi:nitrogen regulatory protein P-II 1